jgi:methionyl-tRNA formyltransferase
MSSPKSKSSKKIKIVFFGTPQLAIPIVETLHKTKNFKLLACVTQPDRPVGRKKIMTPSAIKIWAEKNKIPVLTPTAFDKEFYDELSSISPKFDLIILAAYGLILPRKLLALPKKGCLCLHPSLLPQYRGASPVQATLMNGDQETGLTIFKMDEKMDHGPIVSQFKERVLSDETAEALYSRLFQLGAEVLITMLPAYLEGRIKLRRQDDDQATYTKILTRNDGRINWHKAPEEIERFIRAMTPWPGAWTIVELTQAGRRPLQKRMKILSARLEQDNLVIDQVQLESKTPVSWKELQKGYLEVKIVS